MQSTRKPRWTPIQRNAILFVLKRLHEAPLQPREVGALANDYAKSLPRGHDRLKTNSRFEPCALQDIRNIVSHSNEGDNPIRLGLIIHDFDAHTLSLSDKGRNLMDGIARKNMS